MTDELDFKALLDGVDTGGPNEVDVSAEAINDELNRLMGDHDIEPEPAGSGFDPGDTAANEPDMSPDEIRDATHKAIMTGLKFGTGGLFGIEIKDDVYDETAEAFTDLTIKYFPDGGIFALFARWKEELMAAYALMTFITAFRMGYIAKQKEKAERKEAEKEVNPEAANGAPA